MDEILNWHWWMYAAVLFFIIEVFTPGFIVAAKALLDENPDPSEEEVRYWLAGNLCRCTGYDKIIKAVLKAAKSMRTENE